MNESPKRLSPLESSSGEKLPVEGLHQLPSFDRFVTELVHVGECQSDQVSNDLRPFHPQPKLPAPLGKLAGTRTSQLFDSKNFDVAHQARFGDVQTASQLAHSLRSNGTSDAEEGGDALHTKPQTPSIFQPTGKYTESNTERNWTALRHLDVHPSQTHTIPTDKYAPYNYAPRETRELLLQRVNPWRLCRVCKRCHDTRIRCGSRSPHFTPRNSNDNDEYRTTSALSAGCIGASPQRETNERQGFCANHDASPGSAIGPLKLLDDSSIEGRYANRIAPDRALFRTRLVKSAPMPNSKTTAPLSRNPYPTRLSNQHEYVDASRRYGEPMRSGTSFPNPGWTMRDVGESTCDVQFSAQFDPLDIDREMTLRHVRWYLDNINKDINYIFPRTPFLHWVSTCHAKSTGGLLVLYAMMAVSASSHGRVGHDMGHQTFAAIAQHILDNDQKPTDFHSVLGHVLLSEVAATRAAVTQSQEHLSTAFRMSRDLGLKSESGLRHFLDRPTQYFDLEMCKIEECIRRSCWLLFTGHGFPQCHHSANTDERDLRCDLHLPCDDGAYEAPQPVSFANLDPTVSRQDVPVPAEPFGMMRFSSEITKILSEVLERRTSFSTSEPSDSQAAYDSYHCQMKSRLLRWDRSVQKRLLGFQEPIQKDDFCASPVHCPDTLGPNISMLYIIFHFAAMMLFRKVPHAHMSTETIQLYTRASHRHAKTIFGLITSVSEDGRSTSHPARSVTTCAIVGLATFVAVDIISAAASFSDVLENSRSIEGQTFKEMFSDSIEVLSDLSSFNQPAKEQLALITQRLATILTTSHTSMASCFFFPTPMWDLIHRSEDIIYGTPRVEYLQAIEPDSVVREERELIELQT